MRENASEHQCQAAHVAIALSLLLTAPGSADVNARHAPQVRAAQPNATPSAQTRETVRRILDEASKVIGAMNPPVDRMRPLISLAQLQADADDVARAEETMRLASSFGDLPDDQLTSFAWSAIAKAETRAGRPREALENLLRRSRAPTAGTPPIVRQREITVARAMAMSAIVEELARIDDIQGALALASSAGDEQLRENLRSIVLKAHVERGEIQEALAMLAPILAGWPYEDADRNGRADGAMQAAAMLHGAQGNLVEARRLADNILSSSLQYETLLELPTYHARHGDIEGARALLKELLPGGGGHPPPEAIALPGVAAAQIAAGDRQGALATLTMFGVSREDAQEAVIEILIEQGSVTAALEVFASLKPQPRRMKHQIARAHIGAGNTTAAIRLAEEAPDARDRDFLLSEIAVAQARRGDGAGARRTAALIVDADIRRRAHADIVVAEAAAGDTTALFAAVTAARREDRLSLLLGAAQTLLQENRNRRVRP